MNIFNFKEILDALGGIDPSPFFVLSLVPYLAFLYWAQKGKSIPRISLWGFRLTLLFVAMTIIFAIIAKVKFGEDLTNIDPDPTLFGYVLEKLIQQTKSQEN